jgi:hypothetical protein
MLRWGGRNSVHVVLMLLTPRGGAYWAHPEEGLASFWPNRYTDAINAVNDGLRVRAAPRPDPGPGSITISCMRWHRAHGPVRKRSPSGPSAATPSSVPASATTCAGPRSFTSQPSSQATPYPNPIECQEPAPLKPAPQARALTSYLCPAQAIAAADPFVSTQDCGYIWYNTTFGLRTPDMVTDGMHPTLLGTQVRAPGPSRSVSAVHSTSVLPGPRPAGHT